MFGPAYVFAVVFSLVLHSAFSYEAEVVYEFISVDYNWTNATQRQAAIENGDYIVHNKIITGIKVYRDTVYVTVPRWRNGVPATLNFIVPLVNDYPILQPFPDWDSNKAGDCTALQYVQSMEIDPNTGYMWVIDTGRTNTNNPPSLPQNLCAPKLVIIDLMRMDTIRIYKFPDHVVSHTTNFMNDIVLDYVAGKARFAYITDTSDSKLYVYDYDKNISYYYQHPSMKAVPLDPATQEGLVSAPIDGIAMSPNFQKLYYSTLSGLRLYAIPTDVLRRNNSDFDDSLQTVGNKIGGSDGMAFGQRHIFFGAFEYNALYMAETQDNGLISLAKQVNVVRNNETTVWIDTLAFNGTELWFVANKLNLYFKNEFNFTGTNTNIHIWRVHIGEAGYLQNANIRTNVNSISRTMPSTAVVCMLTLAVVVFRKIT